MPALNWISMARRAPTTTPNDTHSTETPDGVRKWLPSRADAWVGFMRTHQQLLRALDADLAARHGLSLSAFEVLARVAAGPDGGERITVLAEQAMLSQSRVSRLVDQLALRGMVAREACATDSRVVQVVITPAGRELMREAQTTHFDGVEERFFKRLTCDEIDQLASIFAKLSIPDSSCDVVLDTSAGNGAK
jgi:DNA-binding MarR family transcriptional regulator